MSKKTRSKQLSAAALLSVSLGSLILTSPQSLWAQTQVSLGQRDAGATLRLSLSGTSSRALGLSDLAVELNGSPVTRGLGKSPDGLLVSLPTSLSGQWHQIAVYDISAGPTAPRRLIGLWTFETNSQTSAKTQTNTSATLISEIGLQSANGKTDSSINGGGRLSFDQNGGRLRGTLDYAFADMGTQWSVSNWFLEQRFALAGQNSYLRFGDQNFAAPSALIGTTTRRGASLRVIAPNGRHDTSVFALSASATDKDSSLLGLEDANDRLIGFYSSVTPLRDHSHVVGLTAFTGDVPALADGAPGQHTAAGLSLFAPMSRNLDVRAQYDWSESTSTQTKSGAYKAIGADISLLPHALEQGLILSLDYSEMDQDFFTPLTTLDDQGQRRGAVALEYFAADWLLRGDASAGRTNHNGPDSNPVDQIEDIAFEASYIPRDGKGLMANGALSFGASLHRQDRISSPSEADGPQDHAIYSLTAGYDRVTADHAFAIQYSFDWFENRVDGATDERKHAVEVYYGRTPLAGLEASLNAKIGQVQSAAGTYWEADGNAAMTFDLIEDSLQFEATALFELYEDPSKEDGWRAGTGLAWSFAEEHDLVLSADYGAGTQAHALHDGDGWLFGLALRTDVDLLR